MQREIIKSFGICYPISILVRRTLVSIPSSKMIRLLIDKEQQSLILEQLCLDDGIAAEDLAI